jgi:hypothetical protein
LLVGKLLNLGIIGLDFSLDLRAGCAGILQLRGRYRLRIPPSASGDEQRKARRS